MDIKYKNALNEVSQVISLLDESEREKINYKFIKFIETNKSKSIDKEIVTSEKLKNQDLSKEAKAILYMVLKTYLN